MDPLDAIEDISLDSVLESEGNPTPDPAPVDPIEPPTPDPTPEPDPAPPEPQPDPEPNPDPDPNPDPEPDPDPDPNDPVEGDDDRIIDAVIDSLQIEGINKEDFTDDEEGFIKLNQVTANTIATNTVKQFFEKDPLMKQHYEYVVLGGDSRKFLETMYPTNDYSKVELTEDDEAGMDKALRDFYKMKNIPTEDAEEWIKDAEVAGTKFERAKKAIQGINSMQAKAQSELVENQKQQAELQRKKAQEHFDKVKTTITEASDFKGVAIKESEKQAFIDYISKPVNREGQTQRQIDAAKAGLDAKLLVDLLMYRGFDLEKIVNTKAQTTATRSLKRKAGKQQPSAPKTGKQKGPGGYKPKLNLNELDLEKLGLGQ